jgi:UDP-N-acetylglucosamine diphosphorylase/glucosamine-1-phosphate N-acetyltransferase
MADPKKSDKLAVVILAAGKGTRMKSPETAKVMYEINGVPMIDYVIDLALKLLADRILLVVGWQKQSVIDHVAAKSEKVECVVQEEQLGTGHAVLQTMEPLREFDGEVLVLSGDVPLLSEKTAQALAGYHRISASVATILTAEVDDPAGYGRIVRNKEGFVRKIVEDKDASSQELKIREINSGIYMFNRERLFEALQQLKPDNVQGEYYLTDVFEYFWNHELQIAAVKALEPVEVMGINDLGQLEVVRQILASRAGV